MNQWHALCVCREENSVLRYSMAPLPLQHSTTQRTVDVSDRKEKIPTQFPHCLLSFIKFLEKSDVSGMSFMLIGNGKLAGHRKAIEVFYCGVPPQCSAVSERWSVWIYDHQLHVSLSEPREKWSHEGGGAETERHATRGRHPDFYCWGLTALSSDSNGTSFSSKALLSIADLEEKEKLYVLFIMWWEEVRKNRLTAELSQCADGGRSIWRPHCGSRLWFLCLTRSLCPGVDVHPCSGQSGPSESG